MLLCLRQWRVHCPQHVYVLFWLEWIELHHAILQSGVCERSVYRSQHVLVCFWMEWLDLQRPLVQPSVWSRDMLWAERVLV